MQSIVSIAQAQELLSNSNAVFIDTRDPETFAHGHIPGAVNLPEFFTYLLKDSSEQELTAMCNFYAELLGAVGISGDEHCIVYENALSRGYGQSCRGWFILKYLGVENVSVLEGGFSEWMRAELPIETDNPVRNPQVFRPNINNSLLATTDEVLKAIDNPEIIILDVRDHPEWLGESSSPYGVDYCPRKGIIPGAKWIEWTELMTLDNGIPKFLRKHEIERKMDAMGVAKTSKIIIYCFKGSRAANTLLVLRERGGFEQVQNYFGSWNEWSRNDTLPVVVPTAQI